MQEAWLTLAVISIVSLGVFAHKPIAIGETYPSRDEAVQVTNMDVSQVIYTEISPESPQSWIFVETEGAFDLYVSLGIPWIERLTGFRPGVVIIGPGLPPIDLPGLLEIPNGSGAVFLRTVSIPAPEIFHEPFTGTDSWILLQQTVNLPQAGRYDIVALSSSDDETTKPESGKLWIAVGRREQFGVRDILSLPSVIRDVRAFHELPPRISMSGRIRFAVIAAIAGLTIWAITRNL